MSIFNANLKLFLRLSNCASVGEKNLDNYQDARYVCEKKNFFMFTFSRKAYFVMTLKKPFKEHLKPALIV